MPLPSPYLSHAVLSAYLPPQMSPVGSDHIIDAPPPYSDRNRMYQPVVSFLLLAALSLSYSYAMARFERLRLAVTGRTGFNLINVWVFGGILTLPLPLLVTLIAIYCVGEWPARRAVATSPGPYIYSCLSIAASAAVASLVAGHQRQAWPLLVAVLAYCATEAVLLAIGTAAARHYDAMRAVLHPANLLAEAVTALIGAVFASALTLSPALALLVIPLHGVVHQAALREAIRRIRPFDPDTGLWSRRLWQERAAQLLADGPRGLWELVIVEAAEGTPLTDITANFGGWVGPNDMAGRYGPCSIALLIHVGPPSGKGVCSAGIRQALAAAGVPALLGHASAPRGAALEALLVSAASDLVLDGALESLDRR